jgi:tetratricopeptide (TPR) repeat protein
VACLDENLLQDLAQGRLNAGELARAQDHLDACAQCRHLAAVAASTSGGSPAPAEPPSAPTSGLFGRYFVLAPLGRGGMGEVVLAYDPKLDRNVALKRLRPREAQFTAQARARLMREAQAMARLSHPNVIAVHDAGEIDDQVFIAMEYVRGRTLRSWLAEPRGWRDVLAIFRAAGEGLAAAHRAGLIHRDFKPDNVLVGEDGRARVTDFGLARAQVGPAAGVERAPAGRETSGASAAPRTETGALLGTAGYIAPEALRGEVGPLSDQFGFFVSLYEGLYGERPFAGDSLMDQLEAAARGEVRPARSERGVPKRLRELLLSGLAADPARRFASMQAALAALARAAKRRRRWAAGTVAAGIVALAVGAAWFRAMPERLCAGSERFLEGTWDDAVRHKVRLAFAATGSTGADFAFQSSAHALDEWARAWVKVRSEACRATRVFGEQPIDVMDRRMRCLDRRRLELEALVRRFSTADAALVPSAVRAAATLPDPVECAGAAALGMFPVPLDPDLRRKHEELSRQLAETEADVLVNASEASLLQAEQIEREAGVLHLEALRAEALVLIGRLRDMTSKVQASEEAFMAAMEIAQAVGQDALVADAASGLVLVAGARLQRFAEAHHWERLARATLARAGLTGGEQEASLHNNVGGAALFERSFDKAIHSYEEALALWERLHGPKHLRVGIALDNLASALTNANLPERALEHATRSLRIRERLLGPEHYEIARSLAMLGKIARAVGQVSQSRAYCERALTIAARVTPGSDGLFVAETLLTLGVARCDEGDFQGAREAFERARALHERLLGADNPRIGAEVENLAWLALRLRDYGKAAAFAQETIRRFPIYRAEATGYLAEARRRSGDVEQAQHLFGEALRLLEAEAEDPPVLSEVLAGLSHCELARGSRARALEHAERALEVGERSRLPPQDLAQARFALAKALPAAQGERARAQALEARRWFLMGKREEDLRGVDRLLLGLPALAK